MIQDSIQFISFQNKWDVDQINSVLIDKSIPRLTYLRELLFNVDDHKSLNWLFSCFSKHNLYLVNQNCPSLKRIGVYFDYCYRNAFKKEYLSKFSDYAKITLNKKWYFIQKDKNKETVHKIKLDSDWEIFVFNIYYEKKSKELIWNFLKFISFLPSDITDKSKKKFLDQNKYNDFK